MGIVFGVHFVHVRVGRGNHKDDKVVDNALLDFS